MSLLDRLAHVASRVRAAALAFSEPASAAARPILEEVSAEETQAGDWLQPRDEVLKAHGSGDLAIYERLLTHHQVYPTFQQARSEIIARETRVDPGDDRPESKLAAEDLWRQMQRVGWDQLSFRMLAGRITGFSVAEPMYAIEEGTDRVLLTSVPVRRASRFGFGPDRRLRMRGKGRAVDLPDKKFWVFRSAADDDDDPYGFALGQVLYWLVWFEQNAGKFWLIFLERFANPTPKATVPAGTKEEDRNKLLDMLSRITSGGRIVVPRGVDVELIQAVRSSGGDFEAFKRSINESISKVILLQTMTTDQGSSYSQSQVHHRVAVAGHKSQADLLCESFARSVGTWLTEWNYPGAAVPIIYRDFAESADLKALAERDAILSGMGWRPKQQYIIDTYGDNYEYSPPPAPQPGALGFSEPPRQVETVGELLQDHEWRRILGPEVDRVEVLLQDCRTLPEFRDRLGELAMADPAQLADTMARVFFTAKIAGAAEAELEDEDHG